MIYLEIIKNEFIGVDAALHGSFDDVTNTEEQFINDNFIDANGDITEGTIVNLNTVVIVNRELKNVHACITQGQNAPLLLGQSALQKFGKVSIDYNLNEIIFE